VNRKGSWGTGGEEANWVTESEGKFYIKEIFHRHGSRKNGKKKKKKKRAKVLTKKCEPRGIAEANEEEGTPTQGRETAGGAGKNRDKNKKD